jgi:hypothetical protein
MVPVPSATTTEYLVMNCAYHLDMSRMHSAVPADRRIANPLFREVPEDDEEDEDEKKDEEEDDEEGEGYSE